MGEVHHSSLTFDFFIGNGRSSNSNLWKSLFYFTSGRKKASFLHPACAYPKCSSTKYDKKTNKNAIAKCGDGKHPVRHYIVNTVARIATPCYVANSGVLPFLSPLHEAPAHTIAESCARRHPPTVPAISACYRLLSWKCRGLLLCVIL